MSDKARKQILGLLSNGDLDSTFHDPERNKQFLYKLAGMYPATFMRVYNELHSPLPLESVEEEWVAVCRYYAENNKLLEAIKACRTATGWGLKEAKDFCDSLRIN